MLHLKPITLEYDNVKHRLSGNLVATEAQVKKAVESFKGVLANTRCGMDVPWTCARYGGLVTCIECIALK